MQLVPWSNLKDNAFAFYTGVDEVRRLVRKVDGGASMLVFPFGTKRESPDWHKVASFPVNHPEAIMIEAEAVDIGDTP